MSTQQLVFPLFEYHLDESDPDIAILRRQDNAFVAAFSTMSATTEGIVEAAEKDYRDLVRVHLARRGKAAQNLEREDIGADAPRSA